MALLTAMSYAELGSCYHDAGGGYLWVKEGLPKWNGFLSGWMSWFAHAVACASTPWGSGPTSTMCLAEFGVIVPHWGFLSPQKLLAVGIAVLFCLCQFPRSLGDGKDRESGDHGQDQSSWRSSSGSDWSSCSAAAIPTAAFTPFMPNGWGGVFKAMGLTFIAFQGFEVISQCSEEVRIPKKNIPRAVFLSLLIVVPIYLLVAVVSLARSGRRPG